MGVVADVFNALIIDNSTQEVVGTTTLQDAQIQAQVQANNVVGGQGGQILGVLHSQRTFNITLTDIEYNYGFFARQLGQDIVVAAGEAYAMPKFYKVVKGSTEGSKEITLDHAPLVADNMLTIFDANGTKLAATTDFTVSDTKVTILSADVKVGDEIEVRTYKYATDAKTETIEFDGTVFAKGVTLVLETLEIDPETENPTYTLQYQFNNALPDGNFTLATQTQRQAATSQMVLQVIKPRTSNVVGKSLRIPVSA